jgi:hypothetical protein
MVGRAHAGANRVQGLILRAVYRKIPARDEFCASIYVCVPE